MARKATDEHPVLVGHLRELVTALDGAYGLALALDLQRRYLNLSEAPRLSNLTKLLDTQVGRFEAYLEDAERLGEATIEPEDDDE